MGKVSPRRGFKELFSDRDFYKRLFTLAIPAMIQNLISALVNILDVIMIGRLGTSEIAAVALGSQVFFLFTSLVFGIGTGSGIFAAQFWGKGDLRGIRKTLGFCLILGVVSGLVFSLGSALFPEVLIGIFTRDPEVIELGAAYLYGLFPMFIPFAIAGIFATVLRSIEKIKLSMAASTIAICVNLVLNYIFIFGFGPVPAMGVVGAALATVIARIVEMLIMVIVSYIKKYAIAGTIRDFLAFDRDFVRKFLVTLLPLIANRLIWSLAINVQNFIFGRLRTDALAAFNIINTISQLAWAFLMGLGNGAAVLVGKSIGEGNEEKAKNYALRIIIFMPFFTCLITLVLLPLPLVLPLLFNVNHETLAYAGAMLVILALSFPVRAFNTALVISVCHAGGDTTFCAIFDLVFMWFFSLPLAALAGFVFGAPLLLVYLIITAEDIMKMLFLGIGRFKSGKWLHNVVKDL
jgi:putative MATE family efflux protein